MTAPVFDGNGNTRNFDEILERCLRVIEHSQATVESCVTRFPEYKELGETLWMAIAVRGMPRPQMPAAFTAKTRQQLQSHLRARARARDSQAQRRSWLPSLSPLARFVLAVGLVALVLFAGGAGLVRASEGALPGQPLYPVKRVVERGELLFASDQARPGVLFHIAETRIGEVTELGAHGQAIPGDVLADLTDSVNYAILEQPNTAASYQLVDEVAQALRQAEASGSVSAQVADSTLSKLVIRPTQPTIGIQPQGSTSTPGAIAQASTTFTRTPTMTPTLTGTPTPTLTATPTLTLTPTPSKTLPPTQTLQVGGVTAPSVQPSPSPSPTNSPTSTTVPTATPTATAIATMGLPPMATLIATTSVARVFTNVPTVTATATAIPVTATPSETAVTATSATGTAATGEPGSPTAIPDDTPTQLTPETPGTQETATATETETVTPSSTPSPTWTPVPSRTPKPTRTPSRTPSATATATPTGTPTPTATPTATPEANGLPPVSFKQPPQVGTFNNCPPEGQGGDPAYNRSANRTDDGNYQPVALDTLVGLPWPKEVEHKPRDQWPPDAQDQIARADGLPLVVEGYIAQVQQKGPEPQNCQSSTDVNLQLWLVARSESKGDLAKALVAQITPRVRVNHPGWTVDQLNTLAAAGLRVRVSGWLLLDTDHPEDVGKSRGTLWELHPVMQIAVSKDGQWIKLDDYQP